MSRHSRAFEDYSQAKVGIKWYPQRPRNFQKPAKIVEEPVEPKQKKQRLVIKLPSLPSRADAAAYKMPFGKYEDQSFATVAKTEFGLNYLIGLNLQKIIAACSPELHHQFKTYLWTFIHTDG